MKRRRVWFVLLMLLMLLALSALPVQAAGKGYKKAYTNIVKRFEKKNPATRYASNKYALIYLDNNKVPELVCDHTGYYISVYTYKNGKARCLTYRKDKYGSSYYWAYGAMGNHGYYFRPKKNSVYNRDANGAGQEYVDTFFKIKGYRLKATKSLKYDMTKAGTKLPERKKYKMIRGRISAARMLKKLK